MAALQVSGAVRFGVAGVLALAMLADAVIGFSGANAVPGWFVGIVMGMAFTAVAVLCFAIKVPMVGWYATVIAAVATPTTLLVQNVLLAGWAVAMAALELRRLRSLAALPPPPPAGTPF